METLRRDEFVLLDPPVQRLYEKKLGEDLMNFLDAQIMGDPYRIRITQEKMDEWERWANTLPNDRDAK